MRHFLNPLDFTVGELDEVLDLADEIRQNPERYSQVCKGKKIATLFYEPSTRTRLSFEAAMLNLGGSVLGFATADSSSATKGESVSDTIRIVSCYADICAMRHPKEGAPLVASLKSSIPVIDRSLHHSLSKGQIVRSNDWSLWGFKIWPDGSFSHQRFGAVSPYPVCADLTGCTSHSQLYS